MPQQQSLIQKNTSLYNLVVLDFHGTMTDHQLRTIRSYHTAGHIAFDAHFGKEVYQEVMTRPSHASRDGNGETNRQFIESQFGTGKTPAQMDVFIKTWSEVMQKTYIPIPGVKYTVKRLTELGIKLVLLTNGSDPETVRAALRKWDPNNKYNVSDLAKNVYSAVEVNSALKMGLKKVKKPSTTSLDKIFRDLNEKGFPVNRKRTLLVGDAYVDTQLAMQAKVDCALIVRGNGQEQFALKNPRPKYVILEPRELIDIVEGRKAEETAVELHIDPFLWKKEQWYTPHRERR